MFIKPDYNLKCIYDIPLDELKDSGIEVILFDLDSTLMASKSGCYNDKTLDWLDKIQKSFSIAIISNNTNKNYINKVKNITKFPVLFFAHKPSCKYIKPFLKKNNFNINKCILVGDRPLTDVLCGKNLGCKTILVDSITADKESKLVRIVRRLERLVIR